MRNKLFWKDSWEKLSEKSIWDLKATDVFEEINAIINFNQKFLFKQRLRGKEKISKSLQSMGGKSVHV